MRKPSKAGLWMAVGSLLCMPNAFARGQEVPAHVGRFDASANANAYTDRTQMMVLRSGSEHAGHWVVERRDVLLDATKAFGTDRALGTQLAVASDTDNTGESARAGLADLHFVGREAPCVFPGEGTR